jgi:hypothetical protein
VDLTVPEKLLAGVSAVLAPHSYFRIPIQTDFFTRSSEMLAFLHNDNERLTAVTVRFLKINFQLDRFLKRSEGIFIQPVIVFSAGDERIVDNEKNKTFIEKHFFDYKILHYSSACHTLEFEKGITYPEDLAKAILE